MSLIDIDKINFIRQKITDLDIRFHLSSEFGSENENYRQSIRAYIASQYSFHFSRPQLMNLADLNILPESIDGFFSISHSPKLGGFSYSNLKHGFDLEAIERISKPVIQRTCTSDEVDSAPNPKFLWVAKEAALKAVSKNKGEFLVTDLVCENWVSHFETSVYSYRINSIKTLDLTLNKGFVFSEKDMMFAVFFK